MVENPRNLAELHSFLSGEIERIKDQLCEQYNNVEETRRLQGSYATLQQIRIKVVGILDPEIDDEEDE